MLSWVARVLVRAMVQAVAVERIVVMGGGIGGLAVALENKRRDVEVVVIERDPPPPEIAPEQAFAQWARPGVPQFRHAHMFLARLQTHLRADHPELLDELLDAGMELASLSDALPAGVADRVQPTHEDEALRHLWGRRATFEFVLRQHVGRLPHVRFVHNAKVTGLLCERGDAGVRVAGVRYTAEGAAHSLAGDVIVDALGKRSHAPEWLQAEGVKVNAESHPSGFVYACRHYELAPGESEPPRRDGGGNLDYLGYSLFFAERGHFAMTFGCPSDDADLAQALHTTEGFEALMAQFPRIKQWRSRSEVRSKVLGAGRFDNRWTTYGAPGGASLTGFFAVGDSHIETNPMYGRGCATTFVQAGVLAQVLAETSDPPARAGRYEQRCRELLRPYYEVSINTDRMYRARARLRRGLSVPFGERVLCYLFDAAWLPATHTSVLVAREFLKTVQMREVSRLALRLALGVHVAWALWMTWLGRRVPQVVAPPPREEFLRCLSKPRERADA